MWTPKMNIQGGSPSLSLLPWRNLYLCEGSQLARMKQRIERRELQITGHPRTYTSTHIKQHNIILIICINRDKITALQNLLLMIDSRSVGHFTLTLVCVNAGWKIKAKRRLRRLYATHALVRFGMSCQNTPPSTTHRTKSLTLDIIVE